MTLSGAHASAKPQQLNEAESAAELSRQNNTDQ